MDFVIAGYGLRRGEGCDKVWITTVEVPEVVQISVGEDNEAAVLRTGVFPGLFLSHKRILVLGLGLQNDEREALLVQEEEIDPTGRILEIVAQSVQILVLHDDLLFDANVARLAVFIEEPPPGRLEQFVDLDSRRCFVHG